jgi:hypothetical protein
MTSYFEASFAKFTAEEEAAEKRQQEMRDEILGQMDQFAHAEYGRLLNDNQIGRLFRFIDDMQNEIRMNKSSK